MITNVPGMTIYTFDGISFVRAGYRQGDPLRGKNQAIASETPMMGGGVYRDTAGGFTGPIAFQAWFNSAAERDALVAKVKAGVTATLTNSKGLAQEYTLKEADACEPILGRPAANLSFA